MPLTVAVGCPPLYRIHLSAHGFCPDGCRTIHEQLQTGISDAGLAIQLAFPLVPDHEEFGIGSKVIEKIEIVFALSLKVIEQNPVVGPDMNHAPPMCDFIS